jgi:heptosyltransferase II
MRFLIAQTSFLGDVVLSTPVFAVLRRHYPAAHITVLVRREIAGVLEGHPHVDAVLTDDKRGSEAGFGSWRIVRKLRAGHFDVALALHKSFRTAWVLAAAGIGRRIGFRQSVGWFLYHRRVLRDPARHDVERNLSILAGLGLDPAETSVRPYLACLPDAVLRFHAALRERGIHPSTPLVGIAPGSAWATKRWTVDGFAALLVALQRDLGATAVLLGAPGDAACAEAVQRAAGGTGVNLVGRTDLGMLVAAIDQCVVLVANDSAPVHIAVARDTPVVAIFGPTVPRQGFGPYTDRARIVEREMSCRPCGRHGGARCPLGTHACMRDITVADVRRAVGDLLLQCATSRAPGRSLAVH